MISNKRDLSIIIGGDFCPINKNLPFFQSGFIEEITSDFLDLFHSQDLFILNLECPLYDGNSPILKIGPHLRASTNCIKGISKLGVNLFTLANNHILDHDEAGLNSTLDTLENAGIENVGAGIDIAAARKPIIKEVNGLRIGIMAIAEIEFSIASEHRGGANPIDLMKLPQQILDIRNQVDYLIVIIHKGYEGYQYPSPQLYELCHLISDLGAQLVVCQHSHCVGSFEEYKNSLIVYGMGNFLFDWQSRLSPEWYEGIFLKVIIDAENLNHKVDFIPFLQSETGPGIRKPDDTREKKVMDGFRERSSRITNKDFIIKQWHDKCKQVESRYFGRFLINNRYFLKFNDILRVDKLFFNDKKKLVIKSYFCCGDHREVLEDLFKCKMSHE